MWAVEPNETNTEVVLKIEKPSTANNATVAFELNNIPEGTTVEKENDITVDTIENGIATVKVPKKVGTYTLTLKFGDKSQIITIKVIDVTLPALEKIVAETIRQDDQSVITDENIRTNTGKVKLNDADATSGVKNSPATYAGNVNLMKSAELTVDGVAYNTKFYRARFKVEGLEPENIAAYNKDSLAKYLVEKVPNTSNEVYIYLDANLAKINLVIAPKQATINQVRKATSPFVVNFNSTSILSVNSATRASVTTTLVGVVMSDTDMGKNQASGGPITSVSIDELDKKIIDIGAKISDITPYAFDNDTLNVSYESNAQKYKWLGINLRVLNNNDNVNTNTLVSCDDDNVIIDNGTNQHTQVRTIFNPKNLYVWFKAEQEGDTTFTLKFTKDGVTEELPITFRLHDASTPVITSVDNGGDLDVNSKDVIVGQYTANTPIATSGGTANIAVTTYRYAMTETTNADGKKERKFALILTPNIPLDSIIVQSDDAPETWVPLPDENKTSDGKIIVWLDKNTSEDREEGFSITRKTQKIANKWVADATSGIPDNKNVTTINITEKDESELELYSGPQNVYTQFLKKFNSDEEIKLKGVTGESVEPIKGVQNNIYENLTAENAENSKIVISYDNTSKVNTVKYNLSNFDEIKINGKQGRWICLYFSIRDAKNLDAEYSNIKDTLYIDVADAGQILKQATYKDSKTAQETWDLVPVWINLSSDDLKAYIKNPDDTADCDVLKIKLHSTNTEEYNEILLKFNQIGETKVFTEADKAEVVGADIDYNGANMEKAKEQVKELTGHTSDDVADDKYVKSVVSGAKAIEGKVSEPEVIGDTVHLTIKADFKSLLSNANTDLTASGTTNMRIPLKLDISMLGASKNQSIWIYSGQGKKWSKSYGDETEDYTKALTMIINFGNTVAANNDCEDTNGDQIIDKSSKSEVDLLKAGKSIRKTFIFTTKDMQSCDNCSNKETAIQNLRKNNASYVKYVIDFVQE